MRKDYSLTLGENNYIITYENILGQECTAGGDALSLSDAREQFKWRFNSSRDIIKIQTPDEWIDETSTKIVKEVVKHVGKNIGKLFYSTKPIINHKKPEEVDYNSRAYFKDLKKIREEANNLTEMSMPNHEKKSTSFNI